MRVCAASRSTSKRRNRLARPAGGSIPVRPCIMRWLSSTRQSPAARGRRSWHAGSRTRRSIAWVARIVGFNQVVADGEGRPRGHGEANAGDLAIVIEGDDPARRAPVDLDPAGATERLAQGRQQLERRGVVAAQPVGHMKAVDQDRDAAIVGTRAQAVEHEQSGGPRGEREIGVRHQQRPLVAIMVHGRRLAVGIGVDGVGLLRHGSPGQRDRDFLGLGGVTPTPRQVAEMAGDTLDFVGLGWHAVHQREAVIADRLEQFELSSIAAPDGAVVDYRKRSGQGRARPSMGTGDRGRTIGPEPRRAVDALVAVGLPDHAQRVLAGGLHGARRAVRRQLQHSRAVDQLSVGAFAAVAPVAQPGKGVPALVAVAPAHLQPVGRDRPAFKDVAPSAVASRVFGHGGPRRGVASNLPGRSCGMRPPGSMPMVKPPAGCLALLRRTLIVRG